MQLYYNIIDLDEVVVNHNLEIFDGVTALPYAFQTVILFIYLFLDLTSF